MGYVVTGFIHIFIYTYTYNDWTYNDLHGFTVIYHDPIYLSIYIYIKLDLQGFTTSNVWFSNRLPTGMHPQVSAENPLLAQIHPRSLSLSKNGEPC